MNLQAALKNASTWCLNNGIVLNVSKTKLILTTTPQKRSRLVNQPVNLKYKDLNLEITTRNKILSIYIYMKTLNGIRI